MQYKLRTLFVVLTLACVFFAWRAYRLNQQGDYEIGLNQMIDNRLEDLDTVAKVVRERTAELPAHKPTDEELILSDYCFPAGYGTLLEAKEVAARFFYRVRLSDGSETHVGFWVYRRGDGTLGTTFLIEGDDTYAERQSGVAAKRREERQALHARYRDMLLRMPDFLLTSEQQAQKTRDSQ